MKHLNALNKIPGIGPQKIRKLLTRFATAESAWHANFSALSTALGSEKLAEQIVEARKKINPETEWEKILDANITVFDFHSPHYPKLLKEIPNPPYLLYARGTLSPNEHPSISIVGTRKNSPYGKQVAVDFSTKLARAGFLITSGLALGIDAFAHQSTLEAGGKTVAVLGSGIDDAHIYPRINFNLAKDIIANGGLLISEYPPETSPSENTFPARNRIIAGLSLGTLVIEAAESSGALITAKMALECNREVFSIPGPIFSPASQGTNSLIKSGAKLVSNIQDILEEINLPFFKSTPVLREKYPQTAEETLILETLGEIPTHIDKIAKLTKLGTAVVASNLSLMEIKGWTKNIGGQNYILIN